MSAMDLAELLAGPGCAHVDQVHDVRGRGPGRLDMAATPMCTATVSTPERVRQLRLPDSPKILLQNVDLFRRSGPSGSVCRLHPQPHGLSGLPDRAAALTAARHPASPLGPRVAASTLKNTLRRRSEAEQAANDITPGDLTPGR